MCCSLHFWRWSRSIFFFKNGWINYHKSPTKRFDGERNLIGVTYLTICRVVLCQDVHLFLIAISVHNLCLYLRLFWPTLLVLTLQLAIWVGFGYNLQLCRNDQIWDLTGFKERIPDQLVVFFRQETMKHIRIQTGSRKTIHWKMPAGRGYVKFPGGYQISNLSNTTCENGYPPKTPFSTKMKGTHVLKFWHVSPSWDGWCQKHPKTLIFICNIDEHSMNLYRWS